MGNPNAIRFTTTSGMRSAIKRWVITRYCHGKLSTKTVGIIFNMLKLHSA